MLLKSIPPKRVTDVVAWAEQHVKLPGSARSEQFDSSITPWTREPIQRLDDGHTRRMVFIKPIQAGGSVVGEIAACYWAATKTGGDIQLNWQNDDQADARWIKRIEKILMACAPVKARWPDVNSPKDRSKATKGQVIFPHANLTCQGVYTERRVASDSIKYQINEEVHDEQGWLSGRLDQAFGRLTAYWDGFSGVISNAGRKNSELHKAYEDGTQQRWEVPCPVCGQFSVLRTRWEDARPGLGGLRYDADNCRRDDGTYDYQKLAPTIRYQMPCGHEVTDDVEKRRAMSLSGRYGAPANPGAPLEFRSYTLEAVSVDYYPWLSIIMQKHKALRAMKYGDPEPWKTYLRERECVFADDSDRPLVARIVVGNFKKDREGLAGRIARFGALDRQQGSMKDGEIPHWWAVIRDVMPDGASRLVWEGKLETDEDAADVMRRHDVCPRHVVVDSGDDTTHVYQFCLRNGFNAIKGGKGEFYAHEVQDPSDIKGKKTIAVRRIFSVEKPLHEMLNMPRTQQHPEDEPQFWLYQKAGIRDRLHFLRAAKDIPWEVPNDVSPDYLAHMEAEVIEKRKDARGYDVTEWVQIRDRNDLFVCECYVAMLMEMAGLIGIQEAAQQ